MKPKFDLIEVVPENLELNSNGIGPFFVFINWILNEPTLSIFDDINFINFVTLISVLLLSIIQEVPNFIILLATKGPKIFLLERVKKLHVNSSLSLNSSLDLDTNCSCATGYLTVFI